MSSPRGCSALGEAIMIRWLAATVLVVPLLVGASAAASGPACASGSTAAVAAAGPTVWLAGDSTMANPSATCPVGWGSQFGALFKTGVTVNNRAVAGRSIQTWLYEGNVTGTKNSSGECVLSSTTYSTRWQEMLSGM